MWTLLKGLAKDATLYYRQLNFFLILAVLILGGLVVVTQVINRNGPQAATELPRALAPSADNPLVNYTIAIDSAGQVVVNDTPVKGALTYEQDKHRFLLILVREAPSFIPVIEATVKLPQAFSQIQEIEPRIYAIHGVSKAYYRVIDRQTIHFTAEGLYDGSEVSIGFSFPTSYFNLSPYNQLKARLASLPPGQWLLLGTVFPSITGVFLLFMLGKQWQSYGHVRTTKIFPLMPAALPPAVVGALYHGHLSKAEITATIFDLAQRGFVHLHYRGGDSVVFAKGSALYSPQATTLRPFEIFLLQQLFGDTAFASKTTQIQQNLNKELFSQRIAQVMVNIYDSAVAEGYFHVSPNAYYLKYKTIGIVGFFVSLAALLYETFVLPKPDFILLPWIGMIIASLLIIAITPGMPHRTQLGERTLRQWMGFRNYLTSDAPLRSVPSEQFFAYLPYAIVLGCSAAWIHRWRGEALTLPAWFSAETTPYTPEDYETSLLSVITSIAHTLVSTRPPSLA